MRSVFIILCVICTIVPTVVYGIGILNTMQMDANCISYFEMAADANSVELAEKHLSSGIKYLVEFDLTNGRHKECWRSF